MAKSIIYTNFPINDSDGRSYKVIYGEYESNEVFILIGIYKIPIANISNILLVDLGSKINPPGILIL